MKTLATLLYLMLWQTCSTFAQKNFGGSGYALFGGGLVETSRMNEVIGYNSTIPENGIAVGGGGFAYWNRLTIGGSGYGFAGSKLNHEGVDYRITHGFGGMEVGYDILGQAKQKCIAALMYGGRGTIINVESGDLKDKNITNSSPILGATVHWQRLIAGEGSSGFMLGIKGGFWSSFPGNKWAQEGVEERPNIPYIPYGVFIGITVGGGGYSKDKD